MSGEIFATDEHGSFEMTGDFVNFLNQAKISEVQRNKEFIPLCCSASLKSLPNLMRPNQRQFV